MTTKQLTAEERKLLNKLQYKARGAARNTVYVRRARMKKKQQQAQSQPTA